MTNGDTPGAPAARFAGARAFLTDAFLGKPGAGLAFVGTIVVLGVMFQFSRSINHDVAWLLVAAEQWLDGASIYDDRVVEVNPPLIVYLFVIPVAAAGGLGLSSIDSFRLFAVLLVLGSLALSGRLLCIQLQEARPRQSLYLVGAIAYAFFVGVGREFGQREHFLLVLVLPYLLLAAARARDLEVPTMPAILAGIAGGLAISIKPHYLVAVALLEVAIAFRRRSLTASLRLDVYVAVGVAITYVISIFLLTPGYLTVAVPLAIDAYWAYFNPYSYILRLGDGIRIGIGLLAVLLVSRDEKLRDLAWVLWLSALGFYAALLIQGIGWPYHWIPFRGTNTLLFALPVLAAARWLLLPRAREDGQPVLPEPSASSAPIRSGLAAGVGVVLMVAAPLAWLQQQPRFAAVTRSGLEWGAERPRGRSMLPGILEQHARGGYAYFLTPAMVPPFPTMAYSDARWGSRFSCLWILPAVLRVRAGDPAVPDWLTPERSGALEQYLFDAVVEDLERYPPEIILVDRRQTHQAYGSARADILQFFREDPRFEAIWSRYALQPAPVGRFSWAIRRSAGDADPVVGEP